MSGFVRGKVECLFMNKDPNYNAQNAFKVLYDFFTSHPQYTLIALQYGGTNGPASSGAGTGTGYADQLNTGASFGNNAWFVVRQNATLVRPYDVYHYFQWCGGSNLTRGSTFNASPATPSAINGSTNSSPTNGNSAPSVGYQCAIGISGSGGTTGSVGNGFGNPWKGTTNANGADTKGTPVWGPPAGGGTGTMIFPRSCNGPNGAFITKTENCAAIIQGQNDVRDWRFHVVADDDSFIIYNDVFDNNAGNALFYSGIYVPRAGMASGSQANITPYVVLADGIDAVPWTVTNAQIWGDATPGTQNRQGGIIGNTTASVRSLCLDYPNVFFNDTNFQPNNTMALTGSSYYDELQIPVGIYETTPSQICGYLGEIDFVRWAYNVSSPGVRWDFNRAWVGASGPSGVKLSIPWDGQNKTVPRSGSSRTGVTFIRPGPA